eukprot:5510088-Pyramimonas_sp.AAC.1
MGVAACGRCRRGFRGSFLRRPRSVPRLHRQAHPNHSHSYAFTRGVAMIALAQIYSLARRLIH